MAVGCLAWWSLIQEFAYKQFLIVNSQLYMGFRWHIFQVLCTDCLSVKLSFLPRSPSAFCNEYLIWQIIQYLTGYLCCGNLCKPVPVPCFSSFAHLLFCFSSWTQTSSSTAVWMLPITSIIWLMLKNKYEDKYTLPRESPLAPIVHGCELSSGWFLHCSELCTSRIRPVAVNACPVPFTCHAEVRGKAV